MIESECWSLARAFEFEWSVPRSRMSVACESRRPFWESSAAFVAGRTRLLALLTPPAKDR
jgi:hypothetical protein